MISYQCAQRLIERGCEVFLVTVVATAEQSVTELAQIPRVSEFADVFLDEVPRLPTAKEVEFTIDLVPNTAPIYREQYHMAPLEIKSSRPNCRSYWSRALLGQASLLEAL